MNNKHIQDLTVRLSHALDQNYDVVNLDTVLSVISALEGATITKEQLEATRLAKYINQLRRRTTSEQLARRAKSLLKKWREMVGMQPQITESVSDHNTANVTMRDEPKQRSNPISPITISNNVDRSYGKVSKASTGDFLQSSSNPDITTNSIANNDIRNRSLVVTNHSSLSKTGKYQNRTHEIRTDIPNKEQPTSFANLLTGVNTGKCEISSSRKTNKRKDRCDDRQIGLSVDSKTIVVDQSSSSNADSNRNNVVKNELPVLNISPVVIDIQDSNSASNPSQMPSVESCDMRISKAKKFKKDGKLKDQELQHVAPSFPIPSYISNIIEDSCSSQKANVELEYHKYDDRSRVKYPLNGMSEILSLSNSSMSSLFASSTVVGSSVTASPFAANSQRKADKSVRSNNSCTQPKSLTTSDLTFTGKFKQHSSAVSSDMFTFSPAFDTASATKDPPLTNTFRPFSSCGRNSDDSSSNSRTSNFDMIDTMNQDKSQTKLIEEFRQSQKKYNICTNLTAQQNEQKGTTGDGAVQILLPPKTIRQLTIGNEDGQLHSEVKIPKKRGRKKGSRGVDSVIAKETSLSSQMLLSTLGCKKVKTTKELFAEMQNRKLGVLPSNTSPTLSNWLSHHQVSNISRPSSSCSDACSTNATVSTVATRSTPDKHCVNLHEGIGESDSETNSSAPSRGSATHRLSRISSDSNSNSLETSKTNESKLAKLPKSLCVNSIKKQMEELLARFPTKPFIEEIELRHLDDALSCTCKIIESVSTGIDILHDLDDSKILVKAIGDRVEEDVKSKSNNIDVNSCPKDQNPLEDKLLTEKTPAQTLKKSIFDLDFEDEEDPLHKIREEAALKSDQQSAKEMLDTQNKSTKSVEKLTNSNTQTNVLTTNYPKQGSTEIQDVTTTATQQIVFSPFYTIEEDPQCKAKNRYEIQTQQITQFHITALHNCYIPNVNGNWDYAKVDTSLYQVTIGGKSNQVEMVQPTSDDHCQNVVPKYGCLVSEYIPKDLSYIQVIPTLKPKKRRKRDEKNKKRSSQDLLPFLGVATLQCEIEELRPSYKSNLCYEEFDISSNLPQRSTKADLKGVKMDFEMETSNNDAEAMERFNDNNKSASFGVGASGYNGHTDVSDSIYTVKSSDSKPYSLVNAETATPTLNENASCIQFYQNQNDQNINNNSAKTHEKLIFKSVLYRNFDKQVGSRRSSSCSNSSLKRNLSSINAKIRRRRLQQQRKDMYRKSNVPRHRTYGKRGSRNTTHGKERNNKRLKISINGNLDSSRKVSVGSNNSNEGSEYENGLNGADSTNNDARDERIGYRDEDFDYHEVVTRNVSTSSNGSNHIVLTIRKAPSKTNSPSVSPMESIPATTPTQASVLKLDDSTDSGDTDSVFVYDKKNEVIKSHHDEKCRGYQNIEMDVENKLYIPDTLSECKVNLDDTSIVKEDKATTSNHSNISLKNNGFLKSFNVIREKPEHVGEQQQLQQRKKVDGNFRNAVNNVEFSIGEYEEQHQKIPNERCDVFNSFDNITENSKLDSSYNSLKWKGESYSGKEIGSNDKTTETTRKSSITDNSDNNIKSDAQANATNSSWEQKLDPPKEYRTGFRAVDVDVDDGNGNSATRIQQFKEWHQVLQLRSYNDELLTVLPYVVLE